MGNLRFSEARLLRANPGALLGRQLGCCNFAITSHKTGLTFLVPARKRSVLLMQIILLLPRGEG